jgi:PAS domain S-box-containing protein
MTETFFGSMTWMSTNMKTFQIMLRAILVLVGIFILLFVLKPATAEAKNSEDILILHSYHPDLAWTAGINNAMQHELLSHRTDLSLHVEYLDTKRNQGSWYRDSYLDQVLVKKLSNRHFKLILTSDNDAFNFLIRHRKELYSETPIVFSGLNGFTPNTLDDHVQITGVAEVPAFKETIELALQLQPDTTELIFIGETTTDTGKTNDSVLKTRASELAGDIRIRFWNDLPLAQLKKRLEGLTSGQVVFLASTVNNDSKILSFAETAEQISHFSPVPVYGFWDFFLGHGIVGGRLTSSEAQGREAAKLGLQILKGTDPSSIPVTVSAGNRYMFDYEQLTNFKISPDSLPDNSVIVNNPSSYFKLYKWHLWAGLIFIFLLGLCISLLLNIIVIRKRSEKKIAERARLATLAADIGRALTRDTTFQETMQSCCEILLKQTQTAFGRIWVVDENNPELLELQASAGLFTHVETSSHRFKKFGEFKVGIIASERKPILTNNVPGDPLFTDQEWISSDDIISFAGYPLIVNDRVVGVIAFFSKHQLAEHVQHVIASVADMIAVGIERHRTGQALQKSLDEAKSGRENINAIVRSVADGLIVTDLNQRIVLINDAAEKLLNMKHTEVKGKFVKEATKGHSYADQLQNILENSSSEVEFNVPGLNGNSQRTILARTSSVNRRDSGTSGTVAVLHDVTPQRELDRMKSEFIATAAHELRTPLSTIQGYAELMYNEKLFTKMTGEQQHEYLGYIIDRSEALERIIDDLLDVGRAETGRTLILERTPCEMISLVHEIIDHHRLENPDHTYITNCPEVCLKLSVDRNMMHRVFDNLLSNAAKYSPQGGTISLGGVMSENNLVISIKDEGIGMTPEQIGQAFNKFYRVDTSNTAVRGLGLGLTICKTIIDAHGGRIWIESPSQQGTHVHFALPFN